MTPEPCPHEHNAVAWIQAELSADQAQRFAEHLVSCSPCQGFLRDAESLLQNLGGSPALSRAPDQRAAPNQNAAPLATHLRTQTQRSWAPRLALVAAAAALVLAVVNTLNVSAPLTAPADSTPLAWIEAHLSHTGTWPVEATMGLRAQQVGLHSMALMALTCGAAEDLTAERRARIAMAAEWLVAQQNDDGSLGPSQAPSWGRGAATADFDHVVGTRALLESWTLLGAPSLGQAATHALEYLASSAPPTELPSGSASMSTVRDARRGPGNHDAQGALRTWRHATLARATTVGLAPSGSTLPPAPAQGWDELAYGSIAAPLTHRAELSPMPLINAALAVLRGDDF